MMASACNGSDDNVKPLIGDQCVDEYSSSTPEGSLITGNVNQDPLMEFLPPAPEKPADNDCCGTGCVPCVYDIYDQELKLWEKECRKFRQHYKSGSDNSQNPEGPLLCTTEYRTFIIESVTMETRNSYRYRFTLPEDRCLGLKIGQHVVIRGCVQGTVVTRQYTPVSDVEVLGYFDLLIKIYKKGKMSENVRTWTPGSAVELRGPFGDFVYSANKYHKIVMLAAGTGIAPMAQVIQGVLNNEDDETQLQLIYACKNYSDILMKTELQEWSKYWNFSILYVLSQEPACAPSSKYRYGDRIHRGRVNLDLLTSEIMSQNFEGVKILVCGTKSFDKDMLKYCLKLDVPENCVFKF